MFNFHRHLLALFAATALLTGCTEGAPILGAQCEVDVHSCPTGYHCGAEGTCEEGDHPPAPWLKNCSQDSDCSAGVCLPQAQVCVGCIDHDDCISNLCDRLTHICKGCKADYQCLSGTCDEETGICEEESSTESNP